MDAPQAAFTNPDVWRGGSYELYVEMRDSAQLRSLVAAIWSCPVLQGCYRRRDIEPAMQICNDPQEGELSGHLYGLATLPNGKVVACGSFVTDSEGDREMSAIHSLSFAVELGALATAYPVGAYPFGSMADVADWKTDVDSFFVALASHAHRIAPFSFALVGFEVMPVALAELTISGGAVPAEHDHGLLVDTGAGLRWYPATRP